MVDGNRGVYQSKDSERLNEFIFVIYKERTEIDFEGVELQGELVRPQGSLILDRKRASFNSMVWIRADFDDEMDKTVEEIK